MTTDPTPFSFCFYELHTFQCAVKGAVGGILHTPEPYLQPNAAALILCGIFLGFTTLFTTVWYWGIREK